MEQEQQQQQPQQKTVSAARTLGSTGISIGTHLMLESLFDVTLYDESREFKKVSIKRFKKHVYNIYTIIRNILSSYNHQVPADFLMAAEFSNVLQEEIKLIAGMYSGSGCKPLIFYPNYDKLYKAYNIDKKDVETKSYQMHIAVRNFLRDYDSKTPIDCCNDKKTYKHTMDANTIITTHIGLDLFNKGNYYLMESHTGALKSKLEFSTKYRDFGETPADRLPWGEEFYFLLGDYTFVKGVPIRIKRELFNIAKKFQWNVKTAADAAAITLRRDFVVGPYLAHFSKQYSYLTI